MMHIVVDRFWVKACTGRKSAGSGAIMNMASAEAMPLRASGPVYVPARAPTGGIAASAPVDCP
jgi:hypothetical protein